MLRFWLWTVLSVFLYDSVCSQGLSGYYPSATGEIEEHHGYTISYSELHEQAEWVIYFAGLAGKASRKDNFKADPNISTGSARLDDYSRSGYDRGHLFPAGDATWSQSVMDNTFYLSNMSPQKPGFNRGIWKELESLTRSWSYTTSSSSDLIVTGPVLSKTCGSIGRNQVTVPCSYYRIYFDSENKIGVGFILENRKYKNYDLQDYVVSIDEIEILTGIDFFHLLDDGIEEQLESKVNLTSLTFDENTRVSSTSRKEISTAKQCNGIAKSTGKQCRLKTTNENGYCHHHQSQANTISNTSSSGKTNQCQGTTAKGTQCKRTVKGGNYCWQHGG